MTQKLKFTTLLLLVTSVIFAQKNVYDSLKTSTKNNKVEAFDHNRSITLPPRQAYNTSQSNAEGHKVTFDSYTSGIPSPEADSQLEAGGIPISGIYFLVKKNPSADEGKEITTNEKGEAEITISEKGNYSVTVSNHIENVLIIELLIEAGKRYDNSVKVAKTSSNGVAELKDLEIGTYKITVLKR